MRETSKLAKTLLEVVNEESNDYDAIDSMIKILDDYTIQSKVVLNEEMKIDSCAWKLRWDYTGLERHRKNDITVFQKDWNKTIITQMNQISTQINMSTGSLGKYIKAHPNLEPIFKSLEYYKDGILGERYEVSFDDEVESNMVFIHQALWNNFKSIPIHIEGKDGGMSELVFKYDFTTKEKIAYNSKLIGCITVDNYE